MRRALLVLVLFGAVSSASGDQTVAVGPDLSFVPSTVTVAPGEKVTWVWAGAPHSSTSDATSGPEVWDSGILAPPQSFAHTFATVGTYPYYCKVHGASGGVGMSGVVQVVLPVTPTSTPTATASPTATPGLTATATLTPAGVATATPTTTAAPAGPPGAIPTLGAAGRVTLLLGLAIVGLLSLSLALKR